MVFKSPSEECDGILVRIYHYKIVYHWVRNRKAELDGRGVGPQTWGQGPRGIVILGGWVVSQVGY